MERKNSEAGPSNASTSTPSKARSASFPIHNSPRVWFLTSALSPLSVRLIRLLLKHGDYIAAGLPPDEIEDDERSAEFRELINDCNSGSKQCEGWKDRIRGIKAKSQCGAAIAEAIQVFGRIDILMCCTSEAVVGTVEELSTCSATQSLVRDQFETIYFSQINFIKSALPHLRKKRDGHIIVLTGITGHIGTPGMSMYCAATWALEGFCDSLTYEIAPFNVKLTIVQPNKEISVLTNKITFAPQLPQYESQNNPAPGLRDILTNVLNTHPDTLIDPQPDGSSKSTIESRFPILPSEARDKLVMETVHALTAIGGHENPPARHIVGYEGIASVKEKLNTVSEEMEDFVEVSCAVDIFTKSKVSQAALAMSRCHDTGNLESRDSNNEGKNITNQEESAGNQELHKEEMKGRLSLENTNQFF
ncbi:NAD(P)-binding protein [Sclerotinia borealis F-4128]|uniref:NAD(P)-binding protein n=1 Tax=Sclerotinia borealis (strain F-4128) TaxID=1432307 RepID=W9C9Y8_SCLBF|nr:NAD(P)-binding protein [Sclerotinia borealis F-4128]